MKFPPPLGTNFRRPCNSCVPTIYVAHPPNKIKATLVDYNLFSTYLGVRVPCNVCLLKIRSKLSSVLLLCLLRFFMRQTLVK